MAAASEAEGWNIDLGAMATIWRGGCIIRARFLDRIREAYDGEPELANLMLAEFFAGALKRSPGSVAAGRGSRRRAGHPDARLLILAGLLRRLPARPRARQPDPGPARPVRRPHLPAGRPRRARSTSRGARTVAKWRRDAQERGPLVCWAALLGAALFVVVGSGGRADGRASALSARPPVGVRTPAVPRACELMLPSRRTASPPREWLPRAGGRARPAVRAAPRGRRTRSRPTA